MLGDSVRPKNENGSTFTPLNGAEIRSARAVVQDLIAPPDGGNLMTDEAVAALPRGANNFGETVDIGAMWMWREMQLHKNKLQFYLEHAGGYTRNARYLLTL